VTTEIYLAFYNVLTERYEPTDLLRVLMRANQERSICTS